MKIAILSRWQDTANRGVESVIKELVPRLSKDCEIEVFSGKRSDDIWSLLKQDWDIIIPTNGRMQTLKVSLGRLFKNYKMVIAGHSGIGRDDIWSLAICKPDVFIALTDYMADWARKWAWGSQVVKINNGVDLGKFNPSGRKYDFNLPGPIILSVGALVWYKYHERAIEAVSKLEKGSLVIVGDGVEKERLMALGKKKLGERFKIIKVDYGAMPEVYRGADLFTLPSWDREAFGIVYLEAMASGLGVVAPDDPARREIIGNAGLFVDVLDSKKYAQALQVALGRNWRDLSIKKASNFGWDKISKMYEDVFESIISK